ncbi:dynactin subunit 4, putative [Plasmodium reichenowi]|uniref:Dynactin subunit 4 n=1 Tax=Plasmodium reichenowi TaxID=5854 RepID=A0A060RZT0_PLARE|nr:dynactin subunit 4, putative [Plasmodium reichenowi]
MKNRVYLLVDDKLFKLKELYFCVICSEIKNDYNIKNEIEYYFCNGCTQIYSVNESSFYSYQCLRCFQCPFCFSTLITCHEFVDETKYNINHKECHNSNDNMKNSFSEEEIELVNKSKKKNKKIYTDEKDTFLNESINHNKNNMKNMFYFKCPYCLWSSINTVCNPKLEDLIADMINLEKKNNVFRLEFENILDEFMKYNEELKKQNKKKNKIKNYDQRKLNLTIKKKRDYVKSEYDGNNNGPLEIKNDHSTFNLNNNNNNNNDNNNDNIDNHNNNTLICNKSNIKIDKIKLNDILNDEHVKLKNNFPNIYEIQNDNITFLKSTCLHFFDENMKRELNKHMNDKENGLNDETCNEYNIKKNNIIENKKLPNIIIDSGKYPSLEHTYIYPYNYYKGFEELKPLRKKLLCKQSKRCTGCKHHVVKLHNNTNLGSTYRLNNNALKFIPRIYINDFKLIKKENGILNFILINPLEEEMNIKLLPEIDYQFLKSLHINNIQANCLSNSHEPYEFYLNTYDEIIDELIKDDEQNNITNVITTKHTIIKKQNNMALIIMTFIYNDQIMNSNTYKEDKNNNHDTNYIPNQNIINSLDKTEKLNFPIILECSFSDKSKKNHKLKLNLLFTNNIQTKIFHQYALN